MTAAISGGYFIACPACGGSTGLRYACGDDPRPLLIEQWNRRTARSGQAASGYQENARSDVPNGVGVGQPEAPTAAPLEPAAWADDRAIAGGIGNVVSAATKAYWERSHTIDRAMAARMVHPLYAHPPARSGAGSEEGQG